MEIEEPVVLARLPKAPQENSLHKYGPVYGLTAGQKKKRHEVLVAIDGTSVNIYEVEHGTIKASYAIPPAATFLCSPSSIRVKTGKHSYTRYTYCAIRRHSHQRLECFEERFENDLSQGVTSSGATVASNIGEGDIAYLDVSPKAHTLVAQSEEHVLHVLHRNGVVRRYLMGLRQEEPTLRFAELHATQATPALAVRWLTFEDVRNATLQHRPDVLASVESSSTFVSVLYREQSESGITAHVGVWSIPQDFSPLSGTNSPDIAALVVYNLPEAQLWSQEADLECTFNPKATSLLVIGVKAAASYDLSSYSPCVTWDQQLQTHGVSSTRLNNSYVISSTASSMSIFDTKYNSIRAALDLTSIGKKRKRNGEGAVARGHVKIIGYFRELGKVVTLRRNHLLSFELTGGQRDSALIDSIGCGASEVSQTRSRNLSKLEIGVVDEVAGFSPEIWTPMQQRMSRATEDGDAAAFEAVIVGALRKRNSLEGLSDAQIDFILSKIFRCVEDVTPGNESAMQGRHRLQVALPAHVIIILLIQQGHLARHKVQQALSAVSRSGKFLHIEAGMIPGALIESDRSFTLLQSWLDDAQFVGVTELVAAVGTLIDLLHSEVYAHTTDSLEQLLPNDGDCMNVDSPEETPEPSLLPSRSSLKRQPEQPSVRRVLITALGKLALLGSSVITEGLRSSLDRAETLTLIQVLRQQLYEGQHTSSILQSGYPSPPPSAHSSLENRISEPILSLESTSKMLLCCVNAVGPLGFFADDAQDSFMANLIPDLKSETALVTQGLEEAAYLRGVLRETMRYARSADTDTFANTSISPINDAAPIVQKQGTIITLYAEPSLEQGDIDTTTGMLPLSLHADDAITLTKMRKGGGQLKDRTLREVREMENRSKGLYSVQRLVL